MTVHEVRQLHRDDEVHWTDPDDGLCSRQLKILEIRVHEPDPPEPLAPDAEEDCVVWIAGHGRERTGMPGKRTGLMPEAHPARRRLSVRGRLQRPGGAIRVRHSTVPGGSRSRPVDRGRAACPNFAKLPLYGCHHPGVALDAQGLEHKSGTSFVMEEAMDTIVVEWIDDQHDQLKLTAFAQSLQYFTAAETQAAIDGIVLAVGKVALDNRTDCELATGLEGL
jgi:hypothetical protein